MVQKWIRVSLFTTLGLFAVALSVGATSTSIAQDKKDEKAPTIKEIMVKGHKGTDAYLAKIRGAVKGGNWDSAQTAAKGLDYFGDTLGKLDPPKGDKASWDKLAKKYADNTAAVYKATNEKNASATQEGLKAIQGSCVECHKVHKGK